LHRKPDDGAVSGWFNTDALTLNGDCLSGESGPVAQQVLSGGMTTASNDSIPSGLISQTGERDAAVESRRDETS
jgi:hypothetical protein